jgi:MFS family permease
MLWVSSFIDTGYIKDEAEAMTIIQIINVIVVIVLLLSFMCIGHLTDKVPPQYLLSMSFSLRGVGLIVFYFFVTLPNTWFAYMTMVFMALGSIFCIVTLESLFAKHLAKDIRGTMMAIY